jgi:hypothetical protein
MNAGTALAGAGLLDELIARVGAMGQDERAAVAAMTAKATAHMPMVPNPGPQTEAYLSKADVLLYGGQAGGGKTLLELGWGINEADSGIIFRRERTQTDGLEKEGKKIIGESARFNGQDLEWTWPSGKTLKLAGMQGAEDWKKHAGRERDYMGFDEGGEFLEAQVAQIIAWLRAPPGKRTRVIIGSNPPRSSDGQWLMKWFAPWLDDTFANPANPGELRWAVYVTANGKSDMVWVEGPGEYQIDGETYTAKSYTFIPAALSDNPYRNTPEYRAQLQSLPEPLRSQLLYGDFGAGLEDSANQVIPTAWIKAAQDRWTPTPPDGVPMYAMGVDCSGGGNDPMTIAIRHDGWFAPIVEVQAKDIPLDRKGTYCAGQVLSYRKDGAKVIVDMGGGYGEGIYEQLKANDVDCIGHKGAEASLARTGSRQMSFYLKRSQLIWQFREALDPDQPGGSPIALPPDKLLVADLAAPTWEPVSHKGGMAVKVESKEDVCAKLGRSTDRGDAVVMAWSTGLKQANVAGGFRRYSAGKPVAVLMSKGRTNGGYGGYGGQSGSREHG